MITYLIELTPLQLEKALCAFKSESQRPGGRPFDKSFYCGLYTNVEQQKQEQENRIIDVTHLTKRATA